MRRQYFYWTYLVIAIVLTSYGGYFASISDGYIQVHDLSEKYEISGDLNLEQKLAVVALLFGKY